LSAKNVILYGFDGKTGISTAVDRFSSFPWVKGRTQGISLGVQWRKKGVLRHN